MQAGTRTTPTPSDFNELCRLHREYSQEMSNERRNRLAGRFKTVIDRTDSVTGLKQLSLLMGSFNPQPSDPNQPGMFPQNLRKHLARKIENQEAIDRKPITAAERILRKQMRKVVLAHQAAGQQLATAR